MLYAFGVAAVVLFAIGAAIYRHNNSVHADARKGRVRRLAARLGSDPRRVDARCGWDGTPLHHATRAGQLETMKVCLEHAADVNAVTRRGVTPLHFAARLPDVAAARLLLDHGAVPDLQDQEGITPIMTATLRGHDAVARLLKAAGAQDFMVLPPLPIADDDPFMIEARGRARASRPTLLALFAAHPRDACVKVPFQTDTGAVEHIWCDLRAVTGDQMDVRIRSYPRTQKRRVTLDQHFAVSDLEDWQLELPDGKIRGGYSFKVMFQYYRDRHGELPPELADQEKRYVDL